MTRILSYLDNYIDIKVAKYVIFRYNKMDIEITNLKLQKILYIISVAYYNEYGTKLFQLPFSACRLGPKIYDIYLKYARFGAENITIDEPIQYPNKEITDVVDKVIDYYKGYSAYELLNYSNMKFGDWDKTFHSKGDRALMCGVPSYRMRFALFTDVKNYTQATPEIKNKNKKIEVERKNMKTIMNYERVCVLLQNAIGILQEEGYSNILEELGTDEDELKELGVSENADDDIRIRNISADICELFEDLLDKHDVSIPSKDRTGDETEARIYGEAYSDLEDSVTDILISLIETVKENPNSKINSEEY